MRREDLTTDRVLGSGQFGKVLKGRLVVCDEDDIPGTIDVAVKCLIVSYCIYYGFIFHRCLILPVYI